MYLVLHAICDYAPLTFLSFTKGNTFLFLYIDTLIQHNRLRTLFKLYNNLCFTLHTYMDVFAKNLTLESNEDKHETFRGGILKEEFGKC